MAVMNSEMKREIHILTEAEPFSDFHGGAISRVVANLLAENPASSVIAPYADKSWGFASERVQVCAGLRAYGRIPAIIRSHLPFRVRRLLLRILLLRILPMISPGDVVWVHNRVEIASIVSAKVRTAGGKIVLHMHNSHLLALSQAEISKYLDVDMLIFVSHFLKREFEDRFGTKLKTAVLHNAADSSVFFPRAGADEVGPKNQPPLILFASRLVRNKGPHLFLAAMRLLEERGISARGVVVGAAAFGHQTEDSFTKYLRSLKPANVTFLGYFAGSDIGGVFRSADIFCLPSVWNDPFPLAPLEAMASGLPVVASRSGGIPEAFANGGAILVERNSVEELALALERLVTNRTLRQTLSAEGLTSFERNFTWPVIRERYTQLVNDVRADRQAS